VFLCNQLFVCPKQLENQGLFTGMALVIYANVAPSADIAIGALKT